MRIFLAFFFLCHFAFGSSMQEHDIDLDSLKELCIALHVPIHPDIVKETQKSWLRAPGKERWEMSELPEDQKSFVLNWAEKAGHFNEWAPSKNSYDQVILLGGTTPRMKIRLEYLEKLSKEGLSFREIIWLVSDRPLDCLIDTLCDQASTEAEAAQILSKKSFLHPFIFISAPMQGNKRPTTNDTLRLWLTLKSQASSFLFISNQPFCGHQFEVIKEYLPDSVLFDVAGPGCEKSSLPSMATVFLDSLARWIYQKKGFRDSFNERFYPSQEQ